MPLSARSCRCADVGSVQATATQSRLPRRTQGACDYPVMARHARSGPVRDVLKHRLVVAGCALGSLGAFGLAYADRSDHASMLLWSGFGVFVGAITVIVASLSIGPRPLRSLGVGAWMSVAALGAGMGWLGRGSHSVTSGRGLMMPPLLLVMTVALLPLGVWLMVWRPEQNWEKELREERQRGRREDGC